MSLLKRKACCLAAAGLVLICLAALSAWPQGGKAQLLAVAEGAEGQSQPQAGSNERLRALLTERYDILKSIVESHKLFMERGLSDASGLRDATVAMYHAEADLCPTDAERVKVYEKLIAGLREHEAWTERKAAAGRTPEGAVAQAKVARLEAEIRVERLRLGQKVSQLTGRVVDEAGNPAAGAQVALSTETIGVLVSQGTLKPMQVDATESRIVQTDSQGVFVLGERPAGSFDLIVAHDKGFASITSDAFSDSYEIRLQSWGRIEGRVARDPGTAGRKVSMSGLPNPTWFLRKAEYRYETEYSADGRFFFEKVPAGWFEAGYLIRVADSFWSVTCRTPVEVKAGQTSQVTLGGNGRPVVGKFVPPKGYAKTVYFGNGTRGLGTVRPDEPRPDNYNSMTKRQQQEWRREWRKTDEYRRYRDAYWHDPNWRDYTFRINDDGSFRIEDVIAGKYELTVWIEEPITDKGRGEEIGSYRGTVKVPPMPGGRSDEPLDLGQLELTMNEPLRVGEPAPLFEARTLDGKDIRLIDYRGKFVLLSFWQPVSHPEVERLRELYDTYSPSGRLAIIELGGNDTLEEVRKYVEEHHISWPQIFTGEEFVSGIAKDYRLPGRPWIFLVSPDGKIVATGLRGEKLTSTIRKALGATTEHKPSVQAGSQGVKEIPCQTAVELIDRFLEFARNGDPAAGQLLAENVAPEVTRLVQWWTGSAHCKEMADEYHQMRAELLAGLTEERKQFYREVRIRADRGDQVTQVGTRAYARLIKSNRRDGSWVRTLLMHQDGNGVWQIAGLFNREYGVELHVVGDYLNPQSPAIDPAWGETTEYNISADDLARGCYIDFDDRTLHRMTPGSRLTRETCVRLGIDGKCGSREEVGGGGGLVGIDLLASHSNFVWGLMTPLNIQLASSLWQGLGSGVGGFLIKTREGNIGVMGVSGDVNNYYIKFKMLNPACLGSAGTVLKAVQADPREVAAYFLMGGLCWEAELDVSSLTRHPELVARVKSYRGPFGLVRLDTVYANGAVALAVTSKSSEDEYRRFVLHLVREGDRWLVTDVLLETRKEEGAALRHFLEEHPDARTITMNRHGEELTSTVRDTLGATNESRTNEPDQPKL